ncbi:MULTISPECIES: SDR family NAD(P)-dependent oxidoreductase [Brevibacterium]|nr:SDR family oxidoreductase [Brevibacterium sp. CT2-23B]
MRTALITGGARGQGLSHAKRLAAAGWAVVIGDVLDEDGTASAKELSDLGHSVDYRHLDVSDPDSWDSVMEFVRDEHGSLHGLVNNAGIIHVADIVEESLEVWNRIVSVNLTGSFLGLKAASPLLEVGSSVVNVASVFGPIGARGYAAYCSTKAGIIGLTKVAALELAERRIRVNAICPGGVSTKMNEDEPEGGVSDDTPFGRRAEVDEISGTVAFLLSDDSRFITGTEITIDGGLTAK